MSSALLDLFLSAVRVDAQSLRERPMADFIRATLDGLAVNVTEDAAGSKLGGDCGNLMVVPKRFDASRPSVALLAHMDTPRPTGHVKPIITESRVTSDGTTALGVDNRAGASVLLHSLKKHLTEGGNGNFIIVFTVAEELGMLGARHVDLTPYRPRMCFVFDGSKRPGVFIQSAVGCSVYTATFIGKASHAGVAPEKGISAIRIAAQAVDQIPMGRLSPTLTSNVGTISGGTATNVVAERCSVEGEVREFDPKLIDEHLATVRSIFKKVAGAHGGEVEFESRIDFAPFTLQPDAEVFRWTEGILRSVGLVPEPIAYLGGSDANMLNEKGIPAVNLGIGAQNPHGNDEFILLEDLQKSAEIAAAVMARMQ